jgi:hypothetical protein
VVNTSNEREGLFTVNKNFSNRVKDAAAAHRVTLQKNLQHRLEVARANGDEALVRQLEQEASYLKLN